MLLVFSAPAHERKKSGKISGEKQRDGKKEVRADRYPSRTSGDETKGECYGLISPVVTKIKSKNISLTIGFFAIFLSPLRLTERK